MSDQISDRKAKLEKIRDLGVDPYGGRFVGVTKNAEIRAAAERMEIAEGQVLESDEATFTAAGRIVLYRAFGNLIFITVRDWTGEIQFGLSKKMVTEGWKVAKLLDLGDIVGAVGRIGKTKTGELTLWVTEFRLLSKALRPPPEKRLGLTDVEARYRRRYVDLYSNPESREVFLQRAGIIDYARGVLRERGFVEVETPMLQPIYGGAAARPFLTHHNTLDMDLYLRISPELYLKRCLVGGLERVYELSRCFRNEGISPRHNPEFTMLELYQAYGDYHDMMDFCEAFIAGAARDVMGSTRIPVVRREGEAPAEPGSAGASPSQGKVIDYTTPWPRRKYAELFAEHVGIDMHDNAAVRARAREVCSGESEQLRALGRKLGTKRTDPVPPASSQAMADLFDRIDAQLPRRPRIRDESTLDDSVVVNELFEFYVEPKLINPTFVLDWPAALCPLTRRHPDDPNLALRFELFINGMEIGNAYTELNDPAVQRETLSQQLRGEEDETMAVVDDDFVEALECGMPPAGGLGIGIDRVVMLLTGSTSIRDVILFPLQRPQ